MLTYLLYMMLLVIFCTVLHWKIEVLILAVGVFNLYEICTKKDK